MRGEQEGRGCQSSRSHLDGRIEPARSSFSYRRIGREIGSVIISKLRLCPPRRSPRDLRLRPGGDNCFSDRLILLDAAVADANATRDLAVNLDRDATRENHFPGVVRYVDAEELVARVAVAAKLQGR